MILAHKTLLQEIANNRIHVKPFAVENVGVNSIDVHLGSDFKMIRPNIKKYIDPQRKQEFSEFHIDGSFILSPGDCVLGHTIEEIGSDFYVPMYSGRSSVARMFLFSEVSAGFGEIGFKKQWTLELTCIKPIILYPGMRIGQVFFCEASDTSVLYGRDIAAHYANQNGAQESLFNEQPKNYHA